MFEQNDWFNFGPSAAVILSSFIHSDPGENANNANKPMSNNDAGDWLKSLRSALISEESDVANVQIRLPSSGESTSETEEVFVAFGVAIDRICAKCMTENYPCYRVPSSVNKKRPNALIPLSTPALTMAYSCQAD